MRRSTAEKAPPERRTESSRFRQMAALPPERSCHAEQPSIPAKAFDARIDRPVPGGGIHVVALGGWRDLYGPAAGTPEAGGLRIGQSGGYRHHHAKIH